MATCSQGSLFFSYYPEVYGRVLLLFLDCSTYLWSMLSVKQGGIKYHFLSPWYEPRSPGPLANTETIMPTPPPRRRCDTRSIFKLSKTGFRSPRLAAITMFKEFSLPCYLPIARGRIVGYILKLLAYVKCEQTRPGFELE